MNAQVGAPSWTIRAAVSTAEAVCALPAVPTQDWCERAAAAMLAVRQPSIVMVMFAKLTRSGVVERVECVGVSGCSVAEVGTTLRRFSSSSSIVPLGATHPAVGRIRAAAHACVELGWHPGPLGEGGLRAAPASALNGGAATVRARWADTGAAEIVVGATPLGPPDSGRFMVVEIGLTGLASDGAGAADDAAVLDAVLPALGRRAAIAFGGAPFSEATCLTRREEQILDHLLHGKSVRQIAGDLDRSQHTVHDHVKSLHRKLAASSRGALIARALGHIRPDAPTAPDATTTRTISFTEDN